MGSKWLFLSQLFLFSLLIPFLTFLKLTHMTVAQTIINVTGDHMTLLTIKSKVIDDPQRILTSWNHSNTNFCQWQGVTCSARHQRVARLDLSSGGLIGTLSPSVGNLSFIRSIRLFNNSFSGVIPLEIGHLFRLQELRLYNNSFTGNIPIAITNCSNLRVLHLGYNNLVGKIPGEIGSLSLLNLLIVHANGLEGEIPPFIANLTLLETLSLADCQLGGSIPNVFQRLKNLKRLALAENNLVGTIPHSLYNCSSLEQVFLDKNKLTGKLRLNFGLTMPHLEFLALSENRLTYLEISSNISILSPMTNLSYLDISKNHIRGRLNFLDIPTTLKGIDLSSNQLRGSLDHFICSKGVKEMQYLSLKNNHLSGVIPQCWEKWPSLVILNFENNNLSGEIPRMLGFIPLLQVLNLRSNKISGNLPSSLMNLSYLIVLQLGRNELVGSIPIWIGIKLTLLRILNLRFNKFDGSLPRQLCHLSHVQILDLAHNNLSGNIPRCFNNFSIISGIETNSNVQISFSFGGLLSIVDDSLVIKGREYTYKDILGLVMLLDLSSNNFSGQIPSELTTLHELKSLNLSRNQLSGRIPEKIGDMKALESFDLSVNKLSGEISMSLSKLNFMSSFNVSYNSFIGRIPTSTQIQSFSESSFFGNKLCGAPLTNGCMPREVPRTIGDPKEIKGNDEEDWGLIISIVLGFVTGFWIIVTSLIVNRSWRIAYFKITSKLIRLYR